MLEIIQDFDQVKHFQPGEFIVEVKYSVRLQTIPERRIRQPNLQTNLQRNSLITVFSLNSNEVMQMVGIKSSNAIFN